MPLHTISNTGAVNSASQQNITVGSNATVNVLVYNYTGSTVTLVSSDPSSVTSETLTRSSGKQEVITDGVSFTLDADEVVYISIVNGGTATSWRIASGETAHGLAAKPGTGHTGAYDNLAAGIYTATV